MNRSTPRVVPRRLLLGGLAAAVMLGLATSPAGADQVKIQARAGNLFDPPIATALVDDTITWTNASNTTHTVKSQSPDFFSGNLEPGQSFSRAYSSAGSFGYFCTIHSFMVGSVEVERLLLLGLGAPVQRGTFVTVRGRAVGGIGPVTIERDDGTGFHPIAADVPVDQGSFRAVVVADATARYRAVADAITSRTIRIEAIDGPQRLRLTKHGPGGKHLRVHAVPVRPGGIVVLQLRLRERFGWWPVSRARLGRDSVARFMVERRGRTRARVLLARRDGATVLATSNVVRLG